MESTQTPSSELVTTRSAGVRYGLIAGIVSVIYFLALSVSGINMTEGYWNWLGYLITAVILALAHKYYKDNSTGFMSYSQGMQIALWMGLVAAAISSVFTYIYVKFIDTGFIDMIRDKQIEAMEQRGLSEEQIDQAMKIASMFTTPEAMLGFGLVFGVIGALIIGLLVTIFTQKKAPETAF